MKARWNQARAVLVVSYWMVFGYKVVAIEATEPMAYVHMTPESIMYTEHKARSTELTGVNSPYPMEVSVITDQ